MTMGRVFRLLFVVVACLSLLANAVLIGVGVRLSNAGLIGNGIGASISEIPRETRRAYIRGMRAKRADLRALAQELGAHRRTMAAALAADPPDPEALSAAMAEVRAATTRLQTAAHEAILDIHAQSAETGD
ncbi:MAG: periplasmic heavy metal sensor [Pseudomonadota bacterium]